MDHDDAARSRAELIAALQAAEARADRAERTFCRMMRHAPAGFYRFRVDAEGGQCLPYVSPGLCDLLGLPPTGALASLVPVVDRVPEPAQPGFLASIVEALSRRSTWRQTFPIVHPERGERWLEAVATHEPLEPDGLSYYGYVVDATELVEARRRAEASSAAKSAFLATMSHEIRTPLNGMLGMAAVLAHSPANDEQAGMIDVIRRSGESLLRVLNDVIDISGLEGGRLRIEAAPFDLRGLAESTAELFRVCALERGDRLEIRVDPATPRLVSGDAHRVGQILSNLIGNAVKFTERGVVSVEARPAGAGRVAFTVADTGIGMEPEQAARALECFWQADASITRRYGGSGLGLSIVNGLVEAMGGTLSLDSAPGRGTTARVVIPLPAAQAEPSARLAAA